MKKIAIMQPYFFPYIGYFQLINAVDKFIIYDDVNFIKQGWVNRNRILIGGKPNFITVPVKNISSFVKINETEIATNNNWQKKMLKGIQLTYSRSLSFQKVFPLLEAVILSHSKTIAELATHSIKQVCNYLAITTPIIENVDDYKNSHLQSTDRVLDICFQEDCDTYINASGGVELYNQQDFSQKNLQLKFLQPNLITYPQQNNAFVPFLSIIDVLMHNTKSQVRAYLTEYQFSC